MAANSDEAIVQELVAFCQKLGVDVDFSSWTAEELLGLDLDVAATLIPDVTKRARILSKIRGMQRQTHDFGRRTEPLGRRTSSRLSQTPASQRIRTGSFSSPRNPPAQQLQKQDSGFTVVNELLELASMYSQGHLTKEEFARFKLVTLGITNGSQAPSSPPAKPLDVSTPSTTNQDQGASSRATEHTAAPTSPPTNANVPTTPPSTSLPAKSDPRTKSSRPQMTSARRPSAPSPVVSRQSLSREGSRGALQTQQSSAAPQPRAPRFSKLTPSSANATATADSDAPTKTPVASTSSPQSQPLQPKNQLQSTEASKPQLPPLTVCVFGASGDLAMKKTYPALFKLFSSGLISPKSLIFGFARSNLTDKEFRIKLQRGLDQSDKSLQAFLGQCTYVRGSYDKAESFVSLHRKIALAESEPSIRIFYLALPPNVFLNVAGLVKENCMQSNALGYRLIVEKPFGYDLESSQELATKLGDWYSETEIYRIDHYLGKELVQSLMTLRFTNLAFSAIWNRKFISSVTISFKEPFGTEGRGGYFDQSGIIRDIIQNHLLQVFALVAMEVPANLNAEAIRDEKTKVLQATRPVVLNDVVVGQYVADGLGNAGYTDQEDVPKGSITPTFATMVLHVDNNRWKGVPFFVKAGKALNERKAEIRIQLIPPRAGKPPNEIVVRLQPKEAIYMKINTKTPGLRNDLLTTDLDLNYAERFADVVIPEAYERLILDVVNGERQHFVRRDELAATWKILTPILHRLRRAKVQPVKYAFGSRGPQQSDDLMERYGFVKPK